MTIRIIHLLSVPDSEREQKSIAEVSALAGHGFQYVPVTNPPYDGEMPPSRDAHDREFKLTERHYGCYLAHRTALHQYLTPDIAALLICEADCLFTVPVEEVKTRIHRACDACKAHELLVFTFGPKHGGKTILDLGNDIVTTTRLIETHCLLVPFSARDRVMALFELPWDAADYIWTVYGHDQRKERIGIFDDKIIAVQGCGDSLIDKKPKNTEHYFREIAGQN